MEFYWELLQFDGTIIMIPPSAVELIKKRMTNHDPVNTRNAVIPANQIKSFRISDKPFLNQVLIDDVSRAFKEPQLTEDGIKAKWVKRNVTQQMYAKHYSHIPAYRFLAEENGMTVMAYRVPVHLIDVNLTTELTAEEVGRINNKL